jgi:multicomponent Na+:H+ antiporter subunit D
VSAGAVPALPVAVPLLVAAALVGLGPLVRRRLADTVAVATAAAVTALCAVLLARTAGGPVVYWFGGWTPRDGIALGVAFAVDPVGAGLATLAGALATAALVYSWRIFEAVGTLYHALMLVFLAAIVGFCLSGDLFNMFVFYELLSVAAYALAGWRTEDPGSLRGALNFAMTNSVGGFVVLAGIALLYGRTGALNLAQLGQSLAARPADRLVVVAFLLLLVGFFVKAAVVPFHFWLADAYALAPTPVGMLFAGVVSELGLYAVARTYWTVFSGPLPGSGGLRAVLLLAAVATALVGGVMCVLQRHLARMLAYATVSHVGLTMAGVALLRPDGLGGAVLYLVADGLVKAALFVSIGLVQHHLREVDELALRGRGRHLPWAAALMVAGALGLAGVPPFGTFRGKALMEEAATAAGHPWLAAVFVVVAALTSAALLRAAGRVFPGLGQPAPEPAAGGAASDPARASAGGAAPAAVGAAAAAAKAHPHLHGTLIGPAVALLAGALAVGLAPGLAGRVEAAAERFTDRPAYAAAVLQGAAAAEPGQAAAGGHGVGALVLPGALAALSALLGLALAAGALLPERLPRWRPARALARAWRPAAAALAELHSGNIGDSVAWLVVGMAGFGTLLALVAG